MKKWSKLALVSIVALGFGSIGQQVMAQRVTPMQSGRFLQICKKPSGFQICDAYISGVSDSVALSKIFAKNEGDKNAPIGFCIAPSVSGKMMREQVVSWLMKHPDKLSQPVGSSVFTALHEAYPCQPKLTNDVNPGKISKSAPDAVPLESGKNL